MENESSTWYTIYQTIWVSVGLDSYLGTNFAAAVDELIKVEDRFFFSFLFFLYRMHSNTIRTVHALLPGMCHP